MISEKEYEDMKEKIEEYEENKKKIARMKEVHNNYPEICKIIDEINSLGYELEVDTMPYSNDFDWAYGSDENKEVSIYFYFGINKNYQKSYKIEVCINGSKIEDYDFSEIYTIYNVDEAIEHLKSCKELIIKHQKRILPIMEKYNIKEYKE